jgi:hypothetical protein
LSPTKERLTIPVNTQLLSIERLPRNEWAIWIYTNMSELRKPHEERNGTFLQLNIDGSIDRITVSGGETVDFITVLPQIGDDNANKGQG